VVDSDITIGTLPTRAELCGVDGNDEARAYNGGSGAEPLVGEAWGEARAADVECFLIFERQ